MAAACARCRSTRPRACATCLRGTSTGTTRHGSSTCRSASLPTRSSGACPLGGRQRSSPRCQWSCATCRSCSPPPAASKSPSTSSVTTRRTISTSSRSHQRTGGNSGWCSSTPTRSPRRARRVSVSSSSPSGGSALGRAPRPTSPNASAKRCCTCCERIWTPPRACCLWTCGRRPSAGARREQRFDAAHLRAVARRQTSNVLRSVSTSSTCTPMTPSWPWSV